MFPSRYRRRPVLQNQQTNDNTTRRLEQSLTLSLTLSPHTLLPPTSLSPAGLNCLDDQPRSSNIPSNLIVVAHRNSLKSQHSRRFWTLERARDTILHCRDAVPLHCKRTAVAIPKRPRQERVGHCDRPADVEDLHELGPRQARRSEKTTEQVFPGSAGSENDRSVSISLGPLVRETMPVAVWPKAVLGHSCLMIMARTGWSVCAARGTTSGVARLETRAPRRENATIEALILY